MTTLAFCQKINLTRLLEEILYVRKISLTQEIRLVADVAIQQHTNQKSHYQEQTGTVLAQEQ